MLEARLVYQTSYLELLTLLHDALTMGVAQLKPEAQEHFITLLTVKDFKSR